MNLQCNSCSKIEDLSPLRIGRPHALCPTGKGKWLESTVTAPPKKPKKS